MVKFSIVLPAVFGLQMRIMPMNPWSFLLMKTK